MSPRLATTLLAATMAMFTTTSSQIQAQVESMPASNIPLQEGQTLHLVGSDTPFDELYPADHHTEVFVDEKKLQFLRTAAESSSETEAPGETIVRTNPYTKEQIMEFFREEVGDLKEIDLTVTHDENGKRRLNIYGTEDRFNVDETQYPNNVVGMLAFPGGHCTAELVGSSFVMLTNNHCFDDTDDWWAKARFMPGMQAIRNGPWSSTGVAFPTRVITDATHDYAVFNVEPLTVAWPTGNFLGWISFADDTHFNTNRAVSQNAYSGDHAGSFANSNWLSPASKAASQQMRADCSTRGRTGTRVYHDCDSLGGSSGSALINAENQVMVVHHSHFCGPDCNINNWPDWEPSISNLGTPTRFFLAAIQEFDDFVPGGTTTSPTSSTKSPTPSTKSPTPSTKSPTPTTPSPSQPTKSPTPTTSSPTPSTKSPTPSTKSPTPTTSSPTTTTSSPSRKPTTRSPTPSTKSPTPTTSSPTRKPSTKTPTSATTTRPAGCPTACPVNWIGDNICDQVCNVATCEFDRGDCGSPTVPPTKFPTVSTNKIDDEVESPTSSPGNSTVDSSDSGSVSVIASNAIVIATLFISSALLA